MAKEWILNVATNRWGLNKKNSVGPVSEWIRECSPRSVEEWEAFYYKKLQDFLQSKGIDISSQEYLNELGKKLYVKITEVIQAEIEEVTEEDCISYIRDLVIRRTFEGYKTEINTIYGQLKSFLQVEIKPAPDEWDRLYNVDFYIQVGRKFIGIQIKPITYKQLPQAYKWHEWLSKTHKEFEKKFGGKVFTIFSIKRNGKKEICNKEVIEEIKKEIDRLRAKAE